MVRAGVAGDNVDRTIASIDSELTRCVRRTDGKGARRIEELSDRFAPATARDQRRHRRLPAERRVPRARGRLRGAASSIDRRRHAGGGQPRGPTAARSDAGGHRGGRSHRADHRSSCVTLRPRAIFFDVDFTLIYPGPTFQAEGYARFCAEQHVSIETGRFEEAVAAASFILDEIEEQVYDPGLFVHYTATIIERMGGRGFGVVRAAERGARRMGHEPSLRDLRRCRAGTDRADVARVRAWRHLQLAPQPRCVQRALQTRRVADGDHLVGRARFHEPHRSIFEAALEKAGVELPMR